MLTAQETQLQEALGALKGRSKIIERASKMTKKELQEEIDNRIEGIASRHLEGVMLDQMKAEARTLAILLLRRG